MQQTYSILQREVNIQTGKRNVRVCESGTKEELVEKVRYCKIRSLFNQDLTYYLAKQEDSKKAIKKLKKKIVEKDDLYVEIR